MSAKDPNQDFGANEWLVDEMYERYLADPTSLEPSWIEFFKTYNPSNNSSGNSSATASSTSASAPIAGAPRGGVPPTPKAAAAVTPTPVAQSHSPVAQVPVAPAPVAPAAPATPTPQTPASQKLVRDRSLQSPTPADPVVKPVPVLSTPDAAQLEPIRGVGARVVASMEGSLTVPTATSVRAVPAKLMIDNRIVINNHMKRARGGKVSFTHLIAFAMIKALRQMPEMNAFFGEIEGKPAIGHPEHKTVGEHKSICMRNVKINSPFLVPLTRPERAKTPLPALCAPVQRAVLRSAPQSGRAVSHASSSGVPDCNCLLIMTFTAEETHTAPPKTYL